MTPQDPKTRHLSREELRLILTQSSTAGGEESANEPKTTVWSRTAQTLPSRPAEPVTQLEVHLSEQRKVPVGGQQGKVNTDRVAAVPSPPRSLLTRIGIGVLVAGCAWWVGLRPPPPANVSAKASLRAVKIKTVKVTEPVSTPERPVLSVPSAGPAPSPRAAVDLLLAGRQRDARDAYRALVLRSPSDQSFAAIVRILDRELASCIGGTTPCTP